MQNWTPFKRKFYLIDVSSKTWRSTARDSSFQCSVAQGSCLRVLVLFVSLALATFLGHGAVELKYVARVSKLRAVLQKMYHEECFMVLRTQETFRWSRFSELWKPPENVPLFRMPAVPLSRIASGLATTASVIIVVVGWGFSVYTYWQHPKH